MESKTLCVWDESLLQADAVVALLRRTSCLVAFLVLKWQALGACDEYCILLEENNFTDLTFGEKENSEQGLTVHTKQASYASSLECASVTFQSNRTPTENQFCSKSLSVGEGCISICTHLSSVCNALLV